MNIQFITVGISIKNVLVIFDIFHIILYVDMAIVVTVFSRVCMYVCW